MRSRSRIPGPIRPHWQPSQANDRRRSPRLQLAHAGLLHHRDRWAEASILDLSRHGLRLIGSGSFKAGEHVVVELAAPCRRLQLGGRVVWNDHGRKRMAGIAFSELAKDDALALNATVIEARRSGREHPHDVLVVTDDPDAQLALADGIWAHGCEVAMRTTTDGALAYLAADAPRARAALISAGLPARAGQELLDIVAMRHPAIRRVLLVDNLMDAAHAFGAMLPDFVLLSPYRSDEVGRALRDGIE